MGGGGVPVKDGARRVIYELDKVDVPKGVPKGLSSQADPFTGPLE